MSTRALVAAVQKMKNGVDAGAVCIPLSRIAESRVRQASGRVLFVRGLEFLDEVGEQLGALNLA
jgi:hypothetical protein